MIDHIVSYKTSLGKLKKIPVTQSIFSDHNEIKLKISNRKISGKPLNIWKQNDILLNNSWVKDEFKMTFRRHF